MFPSHGCSIPLFSPIHACKHKKHTRTHTESNTQIHKHISDGIPKETDIAGPSQQQHSKHEWTVDTCPHLD